MSAQNRNFTCYADWIRAAEERGVVNSSVWEDIGTLPVKMIHTRQTCAFSDEETPDLSVQLYLNGEVQHLSGDSGFGRFTTRPAPGDFGVCPANAHFDLEGEGGLELLVCAFEWKSLQDQIQDLVQAPWSDFGRLHSSMNRSKSLPKLMQLLWAEGNFAKTGSRLIMDSLVSQIVIELMTLSDKAPPLPSQGCRLSADSLEAVLLFMTSNIASVIRLDDLAESAGVSRYHFLRLFRNAVGETPNKFLRRLRVEKAMQLLTQRESPPLASIAIDCGFCDQPHFTRNFKAEIGVTPRAYRLAKMGKRSDTTPIDEDVVPDRAHGGPLDRCR